jgi:hypothetical protein
MPKQHEGYDLPTNSADFIAFMERVYAHAPGDDFYDKFHDALSTALLCGMKKTGSYLGVSGENFFTMSFKGEIDGVIITLYGSGFRFSKRGDT